MSTARPLPSWSREVRILARLALPVAMAQLASMMLWMVDMLMLGRVSVEALDAASLGRSWIMLGVAFSMGLILGIDPIVSQARGARDREKMSLSVQWGLVVALGVSVPMIGLWLLTEPVLVLLGQDPHLSHEAHRYVMVQIPGLPLFLAYFALRQWLQGRGIMRPSMWIAIASNGVNVLINWLLIFGNLGFPALGVVGAGIATAVTEVFMFGALLFMVWRLRLQRGGWQGWDRRAFHIPDLLRVLRFGLPVALQISLEMAAFTVTTFLSGLLGAAQLASHTIVIGLSSVTFMVPLGVSIASVTRVGNLIGAGESLRARRAAWAALGIGAVLAVAWAAIFYFGRWWLPRLYTDDAVVIAFCAAILPIAAAFQISDGLQVVGGGILRGMGRTLPAAVFNVIGYYVLALPLGWLAIRLGYGLEGLWWALFLGLTVVAALLLVWIYRRGPETVVIERATRVRRVSVE